MSDTAASAARIASGLEPAPTASTAAIADSIARDHSTVQTHTLVRALGVGTGVAIVVGNVIGSGIFVKPGIIAQELGDFRLIMLAWVLGGVLCLLGGICYAELAAMLPRAGGLYVYLREAYGPLAGFLFGWNELLFNRPGSTGALSIIFVGSLAGVLGYALGNLAQALLAVLVVLAVAWVNIRGVSWGGGLQVGTTAIKAGFLVLIAVLPFCLVLFGGDQGSTANWMSRAGASDGVSVWSRFGVVMLAVMWAYNGWHGITPVAEEIRHPERNVPRALFIGIGLLIVLYLGANLAYHFVLPHERIAAANEHAAEEMVRQLFGPFGAAAIAAVIMCSTFGSINGDLLMGPRISFAMGRDRVFFAGLAQVHATYRTPVVAIVVQATMAIALVLVTALLVEFSPGFQQRTVFDLLTNFVIFSASLFYVMAVIAVPILRWKHPEWKRPYRTWGYPLAPLVFVLVYAWFLTDVYFSRPHEANGGLFLILLGVPAYFCYRYASRSRHVLANGDSTT